MTKLVWNAAGQRFFEEGVDRGVLYIDGDGFPWSGLVSVSASSEGGNVTPLFYDGVKYAQVSSGTNWAGSIESIGSPHEFKPCEGRRMVAPGVYISDQPKKQFGFSYRSRISNDLQIDAYRITIVYNALASNSEVASKSLGSSSAPTMNTWSVTTVPERIVGVRPTACITLDSREIAPEALIAIEDILYGGENSAASLPAPKVIFDVISELSNG